MAQRPDLPATRMGRLGRDPGSQLWPVTSQVLGTKAADEKAIYNSQTNKNIEAKAEKHESLIGK